MLLTAGIVASCATTRGSTTAGTVQPGAPGEATRTLTTEEAAGLARPRFSQPDVRFMRGMIPHHAQAIDMAALVSDRTESNGIRLLARRIDISQKDEIRLMERWLRTRGEALTGDAQAGDALTGEAAGQARDGGHALMPGMLTPEEMARLAATSGSDFDRAFLEFMIGHHEGALVMVAELFSSVGGGQETEIHRFASDVDADQDMEILRMRDMLNEIP